MHGDRKRRWGWRPTRRGGLGCGGFLLVLTAGIILSLFQADIGIGISFRIPFTESNATAAAALGAKEKTVGTLPSYTAGRLGDNQNFVNQSQTLTIGPAEGAVLVVLGKQNGAPAFDIHVVAR